MPFDARAAAHAALRAGAQVAIWFQIDVIAFKVFFQKVLRLFLEEALQGGSSISQRTSLEEIRPKLEALIAKAKPRLGSCPFGFKATSEMSPDDILKPAELEPLSHMRRVDSELRTIHDDMQVNFEPSIFKKSLLLACDVKALAASQQAFESDQFQHVYIKPASPADNQGKHTHQQRRALAQRLCFNLLQKCHFDSIHHWKTNDDIGECSNFLEMLEDDENVLLWLDLTTESFLDKVLQEFATTEVLEKACTIITFNPCIADAVDKYVQSSKQNFKVVLCSEDDDGGIEASDLHTDLGLVGLQT